MAIAERVRGIKRGIHLATPVFLCCSYSRIHSPAQAFVASSFHLSACATSKVPEFQIKFGGRRPAYSTVFYSRSGETECSVRMVRKQSARLSKSVPN